MSFSSRCSRPDVASCAPFQCVAFLSSFGTAPNAWPCGALTWLVLKMMKGSCHVRSSTPTVTARGGRWSLRRARRQRTHYGDPISAAIARRYGRLPGLARTLQRVRRSGFRRFERHASERPLRSGARVSEPASMPHQPDFASRTFQLAGRDLATSMRYSQSTRGYRSDRRRRTPMARASRSSQHVAETAFAGSMRRTRATISSAWRMAASSRRRYALALGLHQQDGCSFAIEELFARRGYDYLTLNSDSGSAAARRRFVVRPSACGSVVAIASARSGNTSLTFRRAMRGFDH